MGEHIDVIATTISGSIKDWGKVKQIVPLFKKHGINDVSLYTVDSHKEARIKTKELVQAGCKIIISAGGSGTFNAALEGCYDADVDLKDFKLGFLRKGSADLIGKTLGMPDEINAAIKVFVNSIRNNIIVPCDVLIANDVSGNTPARRFVGYGGAEIFGEIPRFTENRFIKYYKGILSQLFGDLGPFFVGTNLAIISRLSQRLFGEKRSWEIIVDQNKVSHGNYQALIIVNGDLGPNMPFARGVPLGSGNFYLFGLRDIGFLKLYGQLKKAWDSSIMDNAEKWGFETFCIKKNLELHPTDDKPFPLNVDGSTMICSQSSKIEIIDQINLLANIKTINLSEHSAPKDNSVK